MNPPPASPANARYNGVLKPAGSPPKPAAEPASAAAEESVDTWDHHTNSRINKLHPKMRPAVRNFINEVEKTLNIRLRVTEHFRTYKEQDDLYAIGRTVPGEIKTSAKATESYHNYGLAIDVAGVNANLGVDWKEQHAILPKVAPIGKKWGFAWGGDWLGEKCDKPHFEMTFGKTTSQLKTLFEANGKQVDKIPL